MRHASICTAVFGMYGLVFVAPAAAQNMMQHVDLASPEMTAAEMTRAEVEAVIGAATSTRPADFTGKKLSGLDLSGLDLASRTAIRILVVTKSCLPKRPFASIPDVIGLGSVIAIPALSQAR